MSNFDLKSTEFSLNDFNNPSEEYYPVYAWFWNGPITDAESEKQLLEMKRLGIKALYIVCEPRDFRPAGIPTLTDPNYLTDAYFERYKFVVKKASELGMKFWLYDEGGWPSGGACGLVMLNHPEYARRTLDKKVVKLRKNTQYKKSSDEIFASFVNKNIRIEEGFTSNTDIDVDEYYSRPILFETPAKPDVPDATLAESTDYFIKITHEKYKDFIGEYFGNTVKAVFTDEPLAPPIPFRAELVEIYEEKYGESVLPYLPEIFGEVKPEGKALTAKLRWFDLSSRAFCDNFLLKCKKWANKNGLAFTGHLDRDDEPRGSVYGKSFHIMRGLRCMDVPGIDVIWRQIFPNINGKSYENRFYPRYASSAAAQNGTRLAMTESFGVYGNGLTFEQMRYIVGFQAIRGVTLINPMKVSYARRGIWLAGELPSFQEDYACYGYLSHFNRYMERLSYLLTRGNRRTKVALYYPINNFWADIRAEEAAEEFDALGFKMESLGIDFDIVDDDVISESKTTGNGMISIGDVCYSEIVVPPSSLITDKIKADFEKFVSGGGKILNSAENVTRTVDIVLGGGEIVASKRFLSDGEMIFLFNGGNCKKEVAFRERDGRAYLINITSGEIFEQNNKNGLISLELESGECVAVYLTDRILPTKSYTSTSKETELQNFKIRRINSFRFGDMVPTNETVNEEAVDVALGDWADTVGKDFSGTCAYTASFSGMDGDIVLDLGDVRHSCEVILNGESLGVKIMKPYRFNVAKEKLRLENKLEILVTNTVCNQQHFSKTFDKWAPWQLTSYNERQTVFDCDSLESGLFGPAKILY